MVTPAKTGAEHVVWDLSIFYNSIDDPALARDMETVSAGVDVFVARYRGKVAHLSADAMIDALRESEGIYDLHGRIGSYINLMYTTDTTNPTYGALLQKYTEFDAQISQRMLFFELEWLEAEDVSAVLKAPALAKILRYHHYLESLRRYQPYKLSEVEERLLVEKSVTGSSAWSRLFTQIMSAARYEFDGAQLTQSEIMAKLYNPDRDTRQRAAESVTKTLRGKSMELSYIFNVLAADKAADDRRRGYPTWIATRNLANKASDATVEALISAVTANYDIVARHYSLKRKLLGYDALYDYDRYAPLPIEAANKPYHWEQARDTVLSAYRAFSPRMGEIAARFFNENWIHAALMPGKRGGAFAAPTVPSAHPFVLVNFTGRTRDVMTLAHELGHGAHMYLTSEQQRGLIGAHTPLTTSEMASVFGEALVFEDLMRGESDPAARLAMLAQKIEDSFATVFRQISMNRFEDALHTARREEGELSSERISALWMTTQRAMFGDSVTLRDEYAIWWSYIPHFIHTPGYVYAYAFGELLVLALFNLYKQRGAAFVPQYLEVLAAGDSDYPEKILAKVGVDLTNPAFWNEGLNALRALVDQEEALARELYPEQMNR